MVFRGNQKGVNPLTYACKKGQVNCVKALLDKEDGYGKQVLIDQAQKNGRNPAFFACQNGTLEIVKALH